MWQAMGVCVALCALFFFLMAGGMRREKQWKGAVRLTAQVTGLEYRKTWVDSSTIDGDRSSTLITLRCLWEGQPFTLQKELRGIRPSLCQGDRVPIVYLKSQGAWAPWKEVRSLWPVWGLLGALCGGSAVALLFQGRSILAALSDYTVEYPNLPGTALCLIIGIACAAGGFAFVRTLLGDAIRAFTTPLAWGLQKLLGRLEEVPARCEGWINKSDGDGGSDTYPLFSFWESGRMSHWIPPHRPKQAQLSARKPVHPLSGQEGALQPPTQPIRCSVHALCPDPPFLFSDDGRLSGFDSRRNVWNGRLGAGVFLQPPLRRNGRPALPLRRAPGENRKRRPGLTAGCAPFFRWEKGRPPAGAVQP